MDCVAASDVFSGANLVSPLQCYPNPPIRAPLCAQPMTWSGGSRADDAVADGDDGATMAAATPPCGGGGAADDGGDIAADGGSGAANDGHRHRICRVRRVIAESAEYLRNLQSNCGTYRVIAEPAE